MNPDVLFVVGVIAAVMAFPAFVSAYSESRTPRGAILLAVVGGGLIFWAISLAPAGYTLEEIPDVFVRVIGRLMS